MQGLERISPTDAAACLLDAHDHATMVAPLTSRAAGFDLASAYQTQYAITVIRIARGWRVVGRKIGFTNRGIWPLYGVDAPMWAPVFDRTVIHASWTPVKVSLAGTVQSRIEPEILFTLAAPIPVGLTRPEEVMPYIDGYAHSIEIVQSHFPDWKAHLPDFCADNACHARLIVGPVRRIDRDASAALLSALGDCQVKLCRGGQVMLEGRGANALGHPLLALAHLADVVAAQGASPLAAGEIVSTGTLTDALPVAPGEVWSTRFSGLDVQNLEIAFTD
ncbi:MAG: hydratase [Betaproteobacteria bacterium]|nr:hydratase [Betaproteobacteria bacterium]